MTAARRRRIVAWAIGAALAILHVDAPGADPPVLFFGWLPDELAWRLIWILAGWLWLLWICDRVWRSEPEEGAPAAGRDAIPREDGGA